MARTFTTGNYLQNAAPPPISTTGTIWLRLKPTWNSGDVGDHSIFRGEGGAFPATLVLLDFQKTDFGGQTVLFVGFFSGGVDQRIALSPITAGLFVAGTWQNYAMEWNGAAGINFYVNSALAASRAIAFTPPNSGYATFTIGALGDGTVPLDGDLSAYGQWNRLLSLEELTILDQSGSPLSVPNGLVAHFPLIGRNSPETDIVGGMTLPLVGNPAAAPEPRVFLPTGAA